MEKISFLELNLKITDVEEVLQWNNNTISIKQYLPQEEKVSLIQYVLDNSIDSTTSTFSPIRVKTYFNLGIAKWYTNIIFTDEQFFEDSIKTYDKLVSSGLMNLIYSKIPQIERDNIKQLIYDTIDSYTQYANSFVGMLNNIGSDASEMSKELDKIMSQLKNKEGIENLMEIKDIIN